MFKDFEVPSERLLLRLGILNRRMDAGRDCWRLGPCPGEFETLPGERSITSQGARGCAQPPSCLLYIQPEYPLMEFSSPMPSFTASVRALLLGQYRY